MSHDALGGQFADHVKVYRGLNEVAPHEVDYDKLGSHWSHDPEVAYNFAKGQPLGYPDEFDDDGEITGTVLAGLVHRDHIIDPDSDEFDGWRDIEAVQGPDSHEQEATVRPGSPVHLTEFSHVRYSDEGGESEDHTRLPQPREHRA
jgi:hypothetical protein